MISCRRMKASLQSLLERCEDEEERRDLERRIRECDEEIERRKQEVKDTATADDDDGKRSGNTYTHHTHLRDL